MVMIRRNKPRSGPQPGEPNRVTFTNRIDAQLWKDLKFQAVEEERAITYLLDDAVRAYLRKVKKIRPPR
jgi:hypothetical protein